MKMHKLNISFSDAKANIGIHSQLSVQAIKPTKTLNNRLDRG